MPTAYQNIMSPNAIRLRAALALLICCLIEASASPASAQLRMEDVTFRAGGGAAVPIAPSELEGGYGAGFSLETGAGLAVSPSLSVTLSGSYQRFGADAERFEADPLDPELVMETGEFEGGDLSSLSGGFDLRYLFSTSASVAPYLVGGLAVHRIKREDLLISGEVFPEDDPRPDPLGRVTLDSRSRTAFGMSFGLGLQFPLSYTAAFFVEPRYTITFSDPERLHYAPIRIGFVFGEF